MELMNEMIQDSMDVGQDDIEDSDVDNLIANMANEVKNKKNREIQGNMEQEDQAV